MNIIGGPLRQVDVDWLKASLARQKQEMLGKRKPTYAYPARKKAKTYQKANRQFGPGYNPDTPKLYKAPPGAELKYHDFGVDTTTMTTAATANVPTHYQKDTLIEIPAGDGANQRNGSKILIKSIDLRAAVAINRNTSANWADIVSGTLVWRFILYIDSQANGQVAPLAEFFDTTLTNSPFYLYNNIKESGRFKVLMDKFINLDGIAPFYEGGAGQWHQTETQRVFKKHVKLNLPINYGSNTGNLADIRKNNIGIFIFCAGGPAAVTHKSFNYRARVRFTDY